MRSITEKSGTVRFEADASAYLSLLKGILYVHCSWSGSTKRPLEVI
jgi:hypothetical protein